MTELDLSTELDDFYTFGTSILAENSKRHRVYYRVREAVRNGELSRPNNCEDCGRKTKIYAHHPDYSKPLKVEWLCSSCHHRRHSGGELAINKLMNIVSSRQEEIRLIALKFLDKAPPSVFRLVKE
jgi:hypothetical protein